MKKVFLLLVLINIISYSKCELKVKKLIESATIIEEYHSYLEPEYKGDNVYETTIFDENGNILDVLAIKVSTGTVYTIYDFYNPKNTKRIKLYQDEVYKCIEK